MARFFHAKNWHGTVCARLTRELKLTSGTLANSRVNQVT